MELKYDIKPIKEGAEDAWGTSKYISNEKGLRYEIEPIPEGPQERYKLPFGGVASADKQLQMVWNSLDFIPFAKYLRSEDRREFSRMSTGEQAKSLGWETFSLAMYGGVGALGKAGYKGVTALRKAGKIAKTLEPLEDAATWNKKYYGQALAKFLKKDLGGLRPEEYNAIGRAMQGDGLALREALLNVKGATDKYKGLIENIPGVPYAAYRLNKNALTMLADYPPQSVMRRELFDNFTNQVRKGQYFGGKKFEPFHAEAVYKAQAEKFFGKGGPMKELWEATDEELFGFAQDLINHPLSQKLVKNALTPTTAMWIKPIRVVYGAAENILGTLTGIYNPIKKAMGMKNKYVGSMIGQFGRMGEQSGLFNLTKKGYQWKKGFTPKTIEEAGRVRADMDKIAGMLRKEEIGRVEATRLIEESFGRIPAEVSRKHVTAISDTTERFMDQLYKQEFVWRLGKTFEDVGMNPAGRAMFERTMKHNFMPRIERVFRTKGNLGYDVKHAELSTILGDAKKIVAESVQNPNQSWFLAQGKEGLDELAKLMETKLSFGSKGVPHYLENYLPRVYADQARLSSEIFQGMGGKQAAFYTKTRTAVEARERIPLEELIFSRLNAQAKEMFVYDELKNVAKFTRGLPEEWKNLTSHYIARVLGMPSRGDELVARAIEPLIGPIEKIFGRTGVWDAHRVMRLSQNINDITYTGFLGLKPFSAMRNLFQPLVNVPADLGGIRDLPTLIKGYKVGLSKAGREELRAMGVITDYAPELKKNLKFFPTMRKKVMGFPGTSRSEVRDAAMWMFSNSDEMNRYVTGGAAMVKWSEAITKTGLAKVRPEAFLSARPGTLRQVESFMKHSGVNLRYPNVKAEIELNLKAGRFDEARKIFIKDVVADTQYLYGKLDAPLVAQAWGGVGRTAVIFNSWWMNYGTMMQKWMSTGQAPEKSMRMFTWMTSNAIAMTTMKQMWGTQTAKGSTFLGPFPQPDQGILPPAWEPVTKTMAMTGTAFNVLTGADDPEKLEKQARQLVSTLFGFIPAGLQLKQFYRGYEKDKWKGVAKATVKFQPDED